jgi:hypothetical protein
VSSAISTFAEINLDPKKDKKKIIALPRWMLNSQYSFLGLKFEAFWLLQAHFAVVRQCERHIWIGDLEVDYMPTRNVASSC